MAEITVTAEEGLGNATPNQVMKGATFTSEEGFKQTGTMDPIEYTDVVDNLESTSTNLPLSANQGRVLNEKYEGLNESLGEDENGMTIHEKLDYLISNGTNSKYEFVAEIKKASVCKL